MSDISNAAAPSPDEVPDTTIPAPEDETLTTPVDQSTDVQDPTPLAEPDPNEVLPTSDIQTDIPTSTEAGDGTDASETGSSEESTSTSTPVNSGTDASELGTASPASTTSPEATTEPSTSTTSPEADDSGTLGSPDMPVASTPQEPIWPTGTPLPDGIEATQVNVKTAIPSEEVDNRFGFHKATIEGPNASSAIHSNLRVNFVEFAHGLNFTLPQSREASLAMTALEEASMWAHKAIAKGDELIEESGDEFNPDSEEHRIIERIKNLRTRALDTPQIDSLLKQLGLG